VSRRARKSVETRQRMSEAAKSAWADPEIRQHRIEANRRAWADPEVRPRRIAAMQRGATAAEVRHRRTDSLRQPQVRQRMSESVRAAWTPERRAAQSRWSTKMWQERLAGIKAANWLPDDWWKKPLIWRFIADILLSGDEPMSNRKLGEALDATQLIRCPYGHTWAAALSAHANAKSYAATVLVMKVRRWVNKPGTRGKRRRTRP
jgi:hypothetical protein